MKKIIILLITAVICIIFLSAPLSVNAEEGCSLILTYTKEEVIFPDLEINIYRIADRNYEKLSPYDSYPVWVKDITSQADWNNVAVTLRSYIEADSIEAYMTAKTDSDGIAAFFGLEQGLYLVSGVHSEAEGKVYTFYDFMIFISEDLSANPKSVITEQTDEETTYTILKLWKDEDSKNRSAYVIVDIIKDGELYDTVNLDHVNNWSYSFKADPKSQWSVVERQVPEDYFVVITEKSTSFIVTNTAYNTEDDDGDSNDDTTGNLNDDTTKPGSKPSKPGTSAPQTGDNFPMKRYMIILCISGLLLVVLGIGMRRKDNAKSR